MTEALEEAKSDESRQRELLAAAQEKADQAAQRVASDMDSQIAHLKSSLMASEKQNHELQDVISGRERTLSEVNRELKLLKQKEDLPGDASPDTSLAQAPDPQIERLQTELAASEERCRTLLTEVQEAQSQNTVENTGSEVGQLEAALQEVTEALEESQAKEEELRNKLAEQEDQAKEEQKLRASLKKRLSVSDSQNLDL